MSDGSRPGSPAPSSTNGFTRHPLLSTPLYAFALPPELLQILSLRSPLGGVARPAPGQLPEEEGADEEDEEDDAHPTEKDENGIPSTALGCNICRADRFESIQEQRTHFSSDWHRYNVKRKMEDKSTVDHTQWEGLVDSLGDSVNGTASPSPSGSSDEYSSSEEEKDQDDGSTLARVLARQSVSSKKSAMQDDSEATQLSFTAPRSPVLWFDAASLIKDTQFGIYRTIFPAAHKKATEVPWLEDLRRLQVTEDATQLGKRYKGSAVSGAPTEPASRTWTLLAVGGGHFAGMVVSLIPKLHNKGSNRVEREVQILQSKTFHRYTTRRKQGGSQSANDDSKGKAKSAGAQIRRYNEAMLRDDIRDLLTSWKDLVQGSELVFLRASKSSLRTFYDYDEAVLERKDSRIRTFPFPTRRPTKDELIRCFTELTRLKLSHLTAEELDQLDEAYRAALIKAQQKAAPPIAPAEKPKEPAVPKLSKEELFQRDKWERVVDMAKRGRIDALKGFVEKQAEAGSESTNWLGELPLWMDESRASPTLLHVAASSDQPDLVRHLLVDARVDPTLSAFTHPEDSILPVRTAYEVSASRAVRNVFRRAYSDYPDWYDWPASSGARVPSPLTEEQDTAQVQKNKERKNKLKDKLKERQLEREAELKVQEEKDRAAAEEQRLKDEKARRADERRLPARLGGSAPQKVKEQTQLKGLTEEQKMRIERERRAKAAEARLLSR